MVLYVSNLACLYSINCTFYFRVEGLVDCLRAIKVLLEVHRTILVSDCVTIAPSQLFYLLQ